MKDGAHLGACLGLYCIRVIPEIKSVHVAVVEPEPGVVRMIDTFAGAGIERITAGDGDALIRDERKEHGLLERSGPDVRSKRSAVDGDVDAAVGYIGCDLRTAGG